MQASFCAYEEIQMCLCLPLSRCRHKVLILLSISILTAVGSSGAFAQGTGYWHTSGNQIVDSNSEAVRIAGINWYGFETTDEVVHGLWAQDYHTILEVIKSNGYNAIRLPYSNQMVENPIVPSNISYSNGTGAINTDLKGLSTIIAQKRAIAPRRMGSGTRALIPNRRGLPTGRRW
jgi:endoglucanase